MGKYIWRKINVGLWKEAVRWTAVAPWVRVPKASLDFEDKTEKIIDESSIGVIEDSFNGHITKQRSEGSLECNMYANSVWYLLLNLFWAVSTSGANPYTHAFTVAETNQHQSLTIGLADDTQDRQFALAMLDSLEISASVGDFVKVTSNFKAKKSADGSLTPAYSADYALLGKNVKFKIATDLAWLAGASYVSVKSIWLTVSKNLEEDAILWSVEPADFCNTMFWVEGNVELLREDETYKDLYDLWTKKAIRIEIEDPTTTIGTLTYPKLTIDLSSVIFTEYAKNQDNNWLVKQALTFKALYSMTDSKMITATLINTKVSY